MTSGIKFFITIALSMIVGTISLWNLVIINNEMKLVTNIENILNDFSQESRTQGEVSDDMLTKLYIDLQAIGINKDLVTSLEYPKETVNAETEIQVQLKIKKTNHTLVEYILTDTENSFYTFTN